MSAGKDVSAVATPQAPAGAAAPAKLQRNNLTLWDSVRTPDPAHTKPFKRSGGFEGTAINAVYLVRCATELWGPIGGAWGPEIISERMLEGAPIVAKDGVTVIGRELIHVLQIELRYPDGRVPAFGQTTFVGTNKYGAYTDEEAPKKSLTDAMTKALSWLGFGADVHMSMFDDNKYLNEVRARKAAQQKEAEKEAEKEPAAGAYDPDNPPWYASHLQAIQEAHNGKAASTAWTAAKKAAQERRDTDAYALLKEAAEATSRRLAAAPAIEAAAAESTTSASTKAKK